MQTRALPIFAIVSLVVLLVLLLPNDINSKKSYLILNKPLLQYRNISLREHSKEMVEDTRMMDEEWHIDRKKGQSEIPLAVLNIYETLKKSRKSNNCSVVRCHFNTFNNSIFGLYKFNLGKHTNKEDLSDAELHLYISAEVFQNNAFTGLEYLVIRTYQILPTNLTYLENLKNPDLHKLLNVAYVPLSQFGWQIFRVKMAVENWLNGEKNLGLLITVSDRKENLIYPNYGISRHESIYKPFLLVSSGAKVPEFVGNNFSVDPNCSKLDWFVDFKDVGWDNFIIQPKTINVHRCFGNCNAFIKDKRISYIYLLQNVFKSESRRMCCVPSFFSDFPLMFYDEFDNIVLKIYNNLIIDKCNCR